MDWNDLTNSEFFRWFGVTETRRSVAGDEVTVWCKPGGYQQAIDLDFRLDSSRRIRAAHLVLDRRWMDDRTTAPFAADIVKSFLLTVGTNDPSISEVGQQIEQLMGRLPGVISREESPARESEIGNRSAPELLAAYLGTRDHAELAGTMSQLTVDNSGSEGQMQPRTEPRCCIAWTAR